MTIALDAGTEPKFFADPVLEPLIPYDPMFTGTADFKSSELDLNFAESHLCIDADLARAWVVTRRFCLDINSAAHRHRQVSKEALLNTMGSVMYRLIRMDTFPNDSANDALRLGMLAFLSNIFLSWQDVAVPHHHLSQAYQKCLRSLGFWKDVSPKLVLWLLVTGAMSGLLDEDMCMLPRLRATIELCQASSWNELRGVLKNFLWIEILHDRPGQALFNSAGCKLRP